jgi:hypothetical protein
MDVINAPIRINQDNSMDAREKTVSKEFIEFNSISSGWPARNLTTSCWHRLASLKSQRKRKSVAAEETAEKVHLLALRSAS